MGLARLIHPSWLAVAVLSLAGCAEVGKYSVRLDEPEVLRAQALMARDGVRSLELDTDAGRTVSSAHTRVLSAQPDRGEAFTWKQPASLEAALGRASSGVQLVVVQRRPGPVNKRVVHAGAWTAAAGGILGLAGLGVGAGAVLIAGPSNDTSSGLYASLVLLIVGAGVAMIGGTTALVGLAPSIETGVPFDTKDLGRGRVR